MSDRDTLTCLISDCPGEDRISPRAAADTLIELGWRPPAQVITSRAELDAVPAGSVLLHPACEDGNPCIWTNGFAGSYFAPGDGAEYDLDDLESHALDPGSLIVLYTPTETGDGQ